ncbi:MAG: hypothetical protein KF754_11800 [Planctomycetes bacterium]|nr:hypothetical protein [Planctomycetota bacterium]
MLRGLMIGLASAALMSLIVRLLGWHGYLPELVVGACLIGGTVGLGACYPKAESDL